VLQLVQRVAAEFTIAPELNPGVKEDALPYSTKHHFSVSKTQ